MELDLTAFRPAERSTLRLRVLYEQAGYRKYRMARFEEYALYQQYESFLPDAQVVTFTDLDGKLRAIKPDVTLSIAKNAQPAPGTCKKYYYTEQVCRPSRESHTFTARWAWNVWARLARQNRRRWSAWRHRAWQPWGLPVLWNWATWAL